MIEKYIELKMFFEYKLPLFILGIIAGIFVLSLVISLLNNWHEKRQQKMSEKYWGENDD